MSENTYQPFENRVDFSDVQHKMQAVKNELKKVIVGPPTPLCPFTLPLEYEFEIVPKLFPTKPPT